MDGREPASSIGESSLRASGSRADTGEPVASALPPPATVHARVRSELGAASSPGRFGVREFRWEDRPRPREHVGSALPVPGSVPSAGIPAFESTRRLQVRLARTSGVTMNIHERTRTSTRSRLGVCPIRGGARPEPADRRSVGAHHSGVLPTASRAGRRGCRPWRVRGAAHFSSRAGGWPPRDGHSVRADTCLRGSSSETHRRARAR